MRPLQQSEQSVTSVLIWDLPLRLFHWAMVLVVCVAAVTGYLFEDWWLDVHVWAGYALTALLLFRLIWGFVGSYYSRFNSFPLSIGGVRTHLFDLLKGRSDPKEGHNPVGAWMIVLLLTTLIGLVVSGFVVWGGQENNGPLASVISYGVGKGVEDVHEIFANILMGLIGVHLAGVLVETVIFKHDLIRAMLTGEKQVVPSGKSTAGLKHSVIGIVLFAVIAFGLTYWINSASRANEVAALDPVYKQACGECHMAYHPSLRTQSAWDQLMQGLEDHYGEDASLSDEVAQTVSTYLKDNNALNFDTEVAHKIGRINTPSLRITDTRFWQKKHDDFKDADFRHPAVGSKINCIACHKDAETGRFDDASIKLPKGIKYD